MRKVVADENQDDEVDEVMTFSPRTKKNFEEDDPFNLKLKDVRKLRGLSKNYIRKADRRASTFRTGYKGKDGAESKQITDESFYGYGYLDCVTPPNNIDYLTKLFDISAAHRAAVLAKVESVYGLGWDWIESPRAKKMRESVRTEEGRRRLDNQIERVKLEMTELLDEINNIDSWDEIMKKVGTDYETTGNAYIEIGRTSSGQIGYIGHVPSEQIRIRRERDGFIQVIGRDVVYFRNFGSKDPNPVTNDANPNEIIHLRKYSPSSHYYGIPDIISAKNALAGNEFSSRYNLDFFENKAVPRHAIIVKGGSISHNSKVKLLEFMEGLRGQHHRTVYVPLNTNNGEKAEIEFKSLETDRQDFSFGEFRQSNNEEIFMAHRTPPSRAGVFTQNISLAASRDADKVFKEGYSRPEQAIFQKKMAKVFKEMTDVVVFKLNELSLVDEDTQSKIDERDTRMGIVVPNEVRRRRGRGERPDGKGNEPWQANSQQAAEQKTQANSSRARDKERSNTASQGAGDTASRAPKGEGRSSQ